MLFIRWPKRDNRVRRFYFPYEMPKIVLRSLLYNMTFPLAYKVFWYKIFQSFPKKSSLSFYRRSCMLTGSSRSIFRLFKLCRYELKTLSSHGFLPGLRKSSF